MFTWLKSVFFPEPLNEVTWDDLVPGDFIKVYLKDPKQVGIISAGHNMTYQRLDEEDLRTRQIDGFVVCKTIYGTAPARFDTIELNVVKKRAANAQLVTYLLLREEIETIRFIEDKKHE